MAVQEVTRMKLRANQRILADLETALRNAHMGELCSIDQAHKDAVKTYMGTWVIGYLELAIHEMKGGGRIRGRR